MSNAQDFVNSFMDKLAGTATLTPALKNIFSTILAKQVTVVGSEVTFGPAFEQLAKIFTFISTPAADRPATPVSYDATQIADAKAAAGTETDLTLGEETPTEAPTEEPTEAPTEEPTDPELPEGETFSLTTGSDSFVGTAKNDLFTSANGTLAANDTILDSSTTDHDILNIETTSTTGVAARVQNIETINANGTYVAVGYDATSTSGTQNLNLSTSIVGGTATASDVSSINVANVVAGTNIATLNVDSAAGGTRDVVNVDGGAATTVNVSGIATGIDKYNITVADKATLNVTSLGSLSEYTANVGATATIAATTGANTKTFTINAAEDSTVTANAVLTANAANFGNTDFNGAGNVTLKVAAAATALGAQSMTSTGAGTLTVEAAGAAAANDDYSNIKADTLKLTTAQTAAFKVNENTVVNLADTAVGTGTATIDVDNGTSTSIAAGAGTLNVNVSQSQASLTTGAAVGTLLLEATPDAATDTKDGATITIGDLITNAKTSTVVVSGSEALTLTDLTHTDDLVLTSTQLTGKLVVTDTSSTADKNLTIIGGTNDDKVTVTVVASTAATETNNIVLAGAGNDTLIVKGAGTGTGNGNVVKMYGEAGNDTIDASGFATSAAKTMILDGGDGNDTITGSKFADTIIGGAGNDRITVGTGADTVTVGAGNDTVVIAAATAPDITTITDAVIGTDTVVLTGIADNAAALDLASLKVTDGSYAASLGAAHSLTLKGSTATDLSGLIQLGQQAVAKTDTSAAIAAAAYTAVADQNLVAGSLNDNIATAAAGTKGNIDLGAGDDLLTTGGAVTGTITGGAGADTFSIGHATTKIADFGAADILQVTADVAVGVTVTEDFTATAATSNAAAKGNVTLTLKDGVDVDMTLATLSAAANGYTIETDVTTGVITQGATIVGSRGEDAITGSKFADTITGGENADTITAGAGADTIILTEEVQATDTVVLTKSTDSSGTAALITAGVAADFIAAIDSITGFVGKTDKIDIAAFVNGSLAVGSPNVVAAAGTTDADFFSALNTAAAVDGAKNTTVNAFSFNGNQYVVINNGAGATFDATTDSVIQLVGMRSLAATGGVVVGDFVVTHDLSDTAANLAAAAAVLNAAVNITATDAATVAQAEIIADATNTGTTTYSITEGLAATLITAAKQATAADKNGLAGASSMTATDLGEAVTFDNLTADAAATTIDFTDNAVTLTAAEQIAIFTTAGLAADAGDTITVNTLDTLTVTATAAKDTFVFTATDAGVTINSFTTGTDKVDLKALSLDAGTIGSTITADEIYTITGAGAGAADSLVDAATAITSALKGTGSITDASDDDVAYFTVVDNNSSAIYKYTATSDETDVTATELTLVGTFDATIAAGDFLLAL